MQRWPQKDRNYMNLTKAEDIFKKVARIHRRTIQKHLHDPDNHDGVVTHLDRARYPGM